jgi:transcription initiation factor IIE alpha subunit
MGQDDVDKFLRDHKSRWFAPKELAQQACLSINSTSRVLRLMRYQHQVHFRPGIRADTYEYRYKEEA